MQTLVNDAVEDDRAEPVKDDYKCSRRRWHSADDDAADDDNSAEAHDSVDANLVDHDNGAVDGYRYADDDGVRG